MRHLIVDDEPSICELLSEIVSDFKIVTEVKTANSAKTAIAEIDTSKFDVICQWRVPMEIPC